MFSSTIRAALAAAPLALGTLILGHGAALAQATQCKQIECSGRHIECRSGNPFKKFDCERRKAQWKAACEAKKVACLATEKVASP